MASIWDKTDKKNAFEPIFFVCVNSATQPKAHSQQKVYLQMQ